MSRHTHVLANSTNANSPDAGRQARNQRIVAALAMMTVAALYLTGLTRMGMYSVDEPRYADIARTMARTGDWITPKLWGQPWFEKPPLLYWMSAVGFKLGLGDDLSPRLPLALLSVSFLVFFYRRLSVVFDRPAAGYATAMLATSAGWLAYSHVAVTDVPLTACFTAALLLALPGSDGAGERGPARVAAALALGLAMLAKSLPPLILFVPILVWDRRNWRRWFLSWPLVVFLAVATPWHWISVVRNGQEFLYELFIRQQFGRFFSAERQHQQPWWFYAKYAPVLLFPWFPLLPLLFRKGWTGTEETRDSIRKMASVVVFGFIFFSGGVNKLPGYVLPLLPATCALLGAALASMEPARRSRLFIAPVALLGILPFAAAVVTRKAGEPIPWLAVLASVAVCGAIGLFLSSTSRPFILTTLLAAVAFCGLEASLFPVLDGLYSARTLWQAGNTSCVSPVVPRGTLLGLYYYAGKVLPDCGIVDKNAVLLAASGQKK